MKPTSVPSSGSGASYCRTDLQEKVHTAKILSFTTYAASRLLLTPRGLDSKNRAYEALTELAQNYLRADIDCIAKWTAKYGLVTASDDLQNTTLRAVLKRPQVQDLIVGMEKLLLEYLSQNWDSVDEIVSLNRQYFGLRKPSRPLITEWTDSSRYRALKNWQKAYKLAIREIIIRSIGVQRRILTLSLTFTRLKATPRSSSFPQEKHPSFKTKRRPVLLMLGGGMAAGKSTFRDRIKSGRFRTQISNDAIVIEADAIKSQDVVYKALKERFGDDSDLSSLVHDFSTSLAEEMLVRAVNQQQDIVFDGTMTWFPFVEQTIKMIRDHKHNYKRGPGYSHTPSGQVVESYWEIDETMESEIEEASGGGSRQNFEAIAKLVDSATLYHTGNKLATFTQLNNDLGPLKVICRCDSTTKRQLMIDRKGWQEFTRNRSLIDSANSVLALYSDQESIGRTL